MKVLKFIIMSAFVVPFCLHAQTAQDTLPVPETTKWSIGLQGGMGYNLYTINTQYAYDYRYRGERGLSLGFTATYRFNEWIGVRADLSMVQKNCQYYRTHYFKTLESHYRNNYFDIPIMADFSFGGTRLRGHFDLGGYIGLWATSHRIGTIDVVDDELVFPAYYDFDERYEFDATRDNRFDAGICTAAGVGYRLKNAVEFRLEYALFYALTSTTKDYMRTSDPRYNTTHTVQFGINYCF